MPGTVRDRVIGYLRTNKQARANDLARKLTPSVSRVSIHRELKKLTDEGLLTRVGKPPIVFYTLAEKKEPVRAVSGVPKDIKWAIDKDYLYITPQGQIIPGYEGFVSWARSTNQSSQVARLAELYVKTRADYNRYRSLDGWIDATSKLRSTFSETGVDTLLYGDFYTIPQFGKTKLGTLMLYAKQSQNRDLANQACLDIRPMVEKIIAYFEIDAVGFIPPSVPRNIQFMTELANCLNLPLPRIDLIKARVGQVIVAQKTLEKLEERVANARDTIFLKDTAVPFEKILLIDDAVGSGASLNETAKKIKATLAPTVRVIGFGVVGSFKGFEVIGEV